MNRKHPQQWLPSRHMPATAWILTGGILSALLSTLGCQQPGGQVGLPSNPLVGSTRVAPPPTGRVGASSAYAPNIQANQSFNQNQNPYAQNSYVPNVQPGRAPVGLPASDLVAQLQPGGAADYAPTPAPAFQQATYVEASPTVNMPSSASPLAPQLRGMPVIDLTPAGQGQVSPAPLNAQAFQPQLSASTAWQTQAAPQSQMIPQSHTVPLSAVPASPTSAAVSAAAAPSGNQDSWSVVGSGVAAPSTAPISPAPTAAASSNLPWRAPTTAR